LPLDAEPAVVVRRAPDVGRSASATDAAAAGPSEGTVFTRYGPFGHPYPVAGLTVREAYAALHGILRLPNDATALVDGRPVDPSTRLTTGMTLEFVREGGEKGAALSS
jgi:hypothetical protein